ncbi:hypothetical protein DdX_01600 [Ditylenchus destructor]|uniref:Uncharacterized protein n=1 Tax=Ditylenchus destructor TaxID=166010 RepID=A0AAD4RBB7_9BILA|nr:hypothetical protein DdX_01600 [Ditylenchus destructor]
MDQRSPLQTVVFYSSISCSLFLAIALVIVLHRWYTMRGLSGPGGIMGGKYCSSYVKNMFGNVPNSTIHRGEVSVEAEETVALLTLGLGNVLRMARKSESSVLENQNAQPKLSTNHSPKYPPKLFT